MCARTVQPVSAAARVCGRCGTGYIPARTEPNCMACTLSPNHHRAARYGKAPPAPTQASAEHVTFTVPGSPLSVNRVHGIGFRGGKRVMYATAQGRRYKLSVQAHALQALGRIQWDRTRQYELALECYFDNPRSDVDNPIKVVQDALQGVLWDNDVAVVSTSSRKVVDRTAPRLVVTVRAIG